MRQPEVAIIDYGSGNLRSVAKAFAHVALDARITVTADAGALARATHIVLPGVGAYGDCIAGLTALPGMREAMEREAREKGKPFLGICVGMQMLLERGHEHGVHEGLGWIGGEVVRLEGGLGLEAFAISEPSAKPQAPGPRPLKIPHMGWNELRVCTPHPLLKGIANGAHAYFVHSYHARLKDSSRLLATTDYGGDVTAIIGHGNIVGTQFHPEKSQETGLKLLENFLQMT